MANRSLASPKLLKPLRNHFIRRPLNSAAPSAATFSDHSPPPPTPAAATGEDFLSPSPLVDLSDTGRLFAGVPTERLVRAAATLRLAAFPPAVDLGARVMTSRLVAAPVAGDLILAAVRRTFFDHFCAGESAAAAAGRAAAMAAGLRMKGMLVYGVEHADDDVACRNNLDGFLQTVGSARSLESSALR